MTIESVQRGASLAAANETASRAYTFQRHYWMFSAPGTVVIACVIVFPWLFTLWMSLHEWKVGGDHAFVGFANYAKLFTDERFLESVWRTIWFTALATIIPIGLGLWAAGVAESAQAPWRAFGEELGLLFQVVDDVLDGDGYAQRVGVDGARALASESAAQARARLDALDADTGVLAKIVDDLAIRTV